MNASQDTEHSIEHHQERGITIQESIESDKSIPYHDPYIQIKSIAYDEYFPTLKKSKHHNRRYKSERIKNRMRRKSRKINRK